MFFFFFVVVVFVFVFSLWFFVLALSLCSTLTCLSCSTNFFLPSLECLFRWYLVTCIHFTEVVRRFNCRPCFLLYRIIECAIGSESAYAHPFLEVLSAGCLRFFLCTLLGSLYSLLVIYCLTTSGDLTTGVTPAINLGNRS